MRKYENEMLEEVEETGVIVNDDNYRGVEKSLSQQFSEASNDVFTSIANDGSIENKKQVFNAMNNTDFKLSEYMDKPINMFGFLCHKGQINDAQTGEITDIERCVIIDDKGKTYGSISSGVKNSLVGIFQSFGNPNSWEKPLPIKVVEKKSSSGRRFYSVIVL